MSPIIQAAFFSTRHFILNSSKTTDLDLVSNHSPVGTDVALPLSGPVGVVARLAGFGLVRARGAVEPDGTDHRVGQVGALRAVVALRTQALWLSEPVLLAVPARRARVALVLGCQLCHI